MHDNCVLCAETLPQVCECYTSGMHDGLDEVVQYIVNTSFELKNKFTDAKYAPVEFACIFCQTEDEYQNFSNLVKERGHAVQDTPSGKTFLLDVPIQTKAGLLKLLKIREPDFVRKERGDADFNTNYSELKAKYEKDPRFELITRDSFEMLRLFDPEFDVMSCFSSVPLSKDLGITLK